MGENRSALLVMDVQAGIIDRLKEPDKYLANLKTALDYAHRHDLKVFFVVIGFREGMPEIGSSNKSFSAIKESGSMNTVVNPQPAIKPTSKDLVIIKKRVSAFTGSDLEVLLSAQAINHLVLCGIATSGVVLSTLREAADKDYRISVLSDLCADFDPEVHKVLIEKVFPRQSEVLTSTEWANKI